MDPFEETRVKNRYAKLLKKLKRANKFTLKELETLLLIHYQVKEYASLDRRKFRSFIHYALDMTDGSMTDRIFVSFDTRGTNWISIREFIHGLYIYLRGSQKEQASFCFSADKFFVHDVTDGADQISFALKKVYDNHGDGKLTREKMFQLLRRCIIRAPSEDDAEEGAKDLVEALFKFCDQDKDGHISLEDFREAVRQEPLLMEALGPCVPDRPARDAFLTTFAQKPPAY